MAEPSQITVAETSDGPGGDATSGTDVSLPVVEILTGRGFVTGKSGSGKSNSASVIAEKLLDSGFGLLVVDIDGEYYGLKEEYEILHVGGDEECDIQVTTEHAEKIASLALEQNVPIILDVSSYLDEDEAEALLTAVARRLFAKAKKQKQPFLLLVEEVHEYIPEQGSVGECGKMLIKIGKRGRKHGLGICGVSQRPADVKKDFITQCDWLLWHRLTWNNDTNVVRQILDAEYADAVEGLNDGEGFLMTDWSERVRRVQFYRKQTFDAGATPGLDDFERPELKSVSEDLVSELEAISEAQTERESQITELREELDRKNSRIAELEAELQDARDMRKMANQFVDALVTRVEGAAPGRTERERMRRSSASPAATVTPLDGDGGDSDATGQPGRVDADDSAADNTGREVVAGQHAAHGGTAGQQTAREGMTDERTEQDGSADADVAAAVVQFEPEAEPAAAAGGPNGSADPRSEDTTEEPIKPDTDEDGDGSGDDATEGDDGAPSRSLVRIGRVDDDTFSAERVLSELRSVAERPSEPRSRRRRTAREEIESTLRNDAELIDEGAEPLPVRECKADVGALETKARKMLAFYREFGPATPLNAHFAAGGDGDRTDAYAHNRELRTRGLVKHVGRGHYTSHLRERLVEELPDYVDDETVDAYVEEIEATTGL